MKLKFNYNQIDKIVDSYLIEALEQYSIFTFSGPLGVGKTALIKKFLLRCGIKDNIVSPTFNYVYSYKNNKGQTFNHFDLYRIDSLQTFLGTGFDEFLYKPKNYNLIEWPEVIRPLLEEKSIKDKVFNIYLEYVQNDTDCRILKF